MNPRLNLSGPLALLLFPALQAQEPQAAVTADASGKIIIDTRGERPKPALFYRVVVDGTATIQRDGSSPRRRSTSRGSGSRRVLPHRPPRTDKVVAVTGDSVGSWGGSSGGRRDAVARSDGEKRPRWTPIGSESGSSPSPSPRSRPRPNRPISPRGARRRPPPFRAGPRLRRRHDRRVTAAEGFLRSETLTETPRRSVIRRRRRETRREGEPLGLAPEPVEFYGLALRGAVDPTGKTAFFNLSGNVKVSEPARRSRSWAATRP